MTRCAFDILKAFEAVSIYISVAWHSIFKIIQPKAVKVLLLVDFIGN